MRYNLLLLVFVFLSACTPDTWTVHDLYKPGPKQTIHFNDPGGDLTSALATGDLRFVGIMGYAVQLPGVSPEAQPELRQTYGVKVVDGISDVETGTTENIRGPARDYAERYNSDLLRRIPNLKAATQPQQ